MEPNSGRISGGHTDGQRDPRLCSTPNEEISLPDGRTIWRSRSIAALGIVTMYEESTDAHYVAVCRRGPASLEFPGHLALCGGFLDYDESLLQAAVREVWEEVGLNLYEYADRGQVALPDQPFFVMSDPTKNPAQVVSARFHFELSGPALPALSIQNSAPGEASEAFWLKLDGEIIANTNFAFSHARVLLEMNSRYKWWS